MNNPDSLNTKQSIHLASDSCVMCGMCSSQCPTYRISKLESESPRGRLSIIQAWSKDQLDISEKTHAHISHCLHCGQCEKVCPSGVPYTKILNDFKSASNYKSRVDPAQTRIIRLITDTRRRRRLFRQLALIQKSGLRWLARSTGITRLLGLEHKESNTPFLPTPVNWQNYYGPQLEKRGQIGLFIGCVSEILDQEVIRATINTLNRWGYAVHIPEMQTCCGALNRHNGVDAEYQSQGNSNLQAFSPLKISHIAYLASGCGATLTNYTSTLKSDGGELILNRFNRQLIDATDLLIQKTKEQAIQLQALNKKVLIHASCTTRNNLRNEESAANLLSMIPRIKLTTLKMTNNCCGAGGSQLLTPEDINRKLQQDLIDDIETHQPDIIVCSNTGCHIQIQNGLKKKGLDIPVIHPVVLFHQQLV